MGRSCALSSLRPAPCRSVLAHQNRKPRPSDAAAHSNSRDGAVSESQQGIIVSTATRRWAASARGLSASACIRGACRTNRGRDLVRRERLANDSGGDIGRCVRHLCIACCHDARYRHRVERSRKIQCIRRETQVQVDDRCLRLPTPREHQPCTSRTSRPQYAMAGLFYVVREMQGRQRLICNDQHFHVTTSGADSRQDTASSQPSGARQGWRLGVQGKGAGRADPDFRDVPFPPGCATAHFRTRRLSRPVMLPPPAAKSSLTRHQSRHHHHV